LIRTFLIALAALAAAVPQTMLAQEKTRVVTTSADLKSLVEAVGGDRVEAESLAAPELDPHAIELKPGQVARLRSAAVLVRIGLDHEPWLARVLPTSKTLVVDASKTIRLLQTETLREASGTQTTGPL
jgi:ABC-type Zn uptake system ZnuABC Zn-binding protein ZnuA